MDHLLLGRSYIVFSFFDRLFPRMKCIYVLLFVTGTFPGLLPCLHSWCWCTYLVFMTLMECNFVYLLEYCS